MSTPFACETRREALGAEVERRIEQAHLIFVGITVFNIVVAVLLGWALLGQSITGVALLGLIAVLGSILAVQWAAAAKPAVTAPHVKVARCTTPTAQGDN